jgi:hypothetical protein
MSGGPFAKSICFAVVLAVGLLASTNMEITFADETPKAEEKKMRTLGVVLYPGFEVLDV